MKQAMTTKTMITMTTADGLYCAAALSSAWPQNQYKTRERDLKKAIQGQLGGGINNDKVGQRICSI